MANFYYSNIKLSIIFHFLQNLAAFIAKFNIFEFFCEIMMVCVFAENRHQNKIIRKIYIFILCFFYLLMSLILKYYFSEI